MNVPAAVRPLYLLVSGLSVLALAMVSMIVVNSGLSLPDLASLELSVASSLLMATFGI